VYLALHKALHLEFRNAGRAKKTRMMAIPDGVKSLMIYTIVPILYQNWTYRRTGRQKCCIEQ